MKLFLDESGDKGLKVADGSTPWLVIGGPLFQDPEEADRCEARIVRLSQEQQIREFHFTKDAPERKRLFIESVLDFNFSYFAVACNKGAMNLGTWKNPQHLFEHLLGRLLDQVLPRLRDCSVRFDSTGGKKTDREYVNFVRQRCNSRRETREIADIKAGGSHAFGLAQLADYVCSAILRSKMEVRKGANEYYSMLKVKEEILLEVP